jgi:hypothetical protein
MGQIKIPGRRSSSGLTHDGAINLPDVSLRLLLYMLRLTATGRPRCRPRSITATTTNLPRTENAPEKLSCQTSCTTSRRGDVRVVIIRDTQTESDGTVGTDELEDNAEDVEPRRVGYIVEWSSLYTVSTQ